MAQEQHDQALAKSRYVYIKNGDVVSQMQRIRAHWPTAIASGPDAFLYDFLASNRSGSVLLMARARRAARAVFDKIDTWVFPERLGLGGRLPARVLLFFKVLSRILAYRPERIICGTTGAPLWASYIASRCLSIPWVHSRHNRVSLDQESWLRKISLTMDGYLVRRADGVVCHGPYLRDELLKTGIDASRLYEFDISFSDFSPPEPSNESSTLPWGESPYILYMGRIERNKGVFDLLEAFGDCKKSNWRVKLVYAGDGRHLEELKKSVEDLGLQDSVIIMGRVPHSDLQYIVSHSYAVVTPTHADFPEGRCMAAMEALVLGVPVIASSFGPFLYLVKDKHNGLLFEPGNVSDLKEKLELLFNHPSLRSRLRIGAKHSGDKLRRPPLTFSEAVNKAFAGTP